MRSASTCAETVAAASGRCSASAGSRRPCDGHPLNARRSAAVALGADVIPPTQTVGSGSRVIVRAGPCGRSGRSLLRGLASCGWRASASWRIAFSRMKASNAVRRVAWSITPPTAGQAPEERDGGRLPPRDDEEREAAGHQHDRSDGNAAAGPQHAEEGAEADEGEAQRRGTLRMSALLPRHRDRGCSSHRPGACGSSRPPGRAQVSASSGSSCAVRATSLRGGEAVLLQSDGAQEGGEGRR